uniref:Uncharacterized protein n=1 Tax=Timema shepardi TaxID=629360 RepID=A0A7R9ARQ4_TIMSH|nr:unnamed protein product [Timema shepardi]
MSETNALWVSPCVTEEIYPLELPNGHINFEKFWQLAKQVTEFITWKQVVCPFEKNTKVITFLQASPVLLENALALASFECEPPDNNLEKERYKTLKRLPLKKRALSKGPYAPPHAFLNLSPL